MAQLKDTTVSGSLRATDTIYTSTLQTQILHAPTTSNGTSYGAGTNGQILRTNGTSAYWGNGVTSLKLQTSTPLSGGSATATTGDSSYTIGFANQNPNKVLAGPSTGSTANTPTFRSLVEDDIPTISASKASLGNVSNNTNLNNVTGAKGDIIYWQALNTPVHLTNTNSTTKHFLSITSQVPSWTTLSKGDVGLGKVDNTADSEKNVATARLVSSAPNNMTTFLRGDNVWSNTLLGTLYIGDLSNDGINSICCQGTSGAISFFSQGGGYGYRGLGANAIGTVNWKDIIVVDSNNDSTFYGTLDGNAATATKLFNTPNNTTTFLRGDNSWSNNLTGGLCISLINNSSTDYATTVICGGTNGKPRSGGISVWKGGNEVTNYELASLSIEAEASTSTAGVVCFTIGCGKDQASNYTDNYIGKLRIKYSASVYSDITAKYGTVISSINTNYLDISTWLKATGVVGAVWNDYAEFRKTNKKAKAGQVVIDNDDGTLSITDKRLLSGAQVISDTFGFSIGETEEAKTPLAVSGRVLAYTYRPREEYHAGMAVCSAPNGTVDIMTREEIQQYPDAIIGIVSEIPDYEEWGTGKIKVNKRIWIKVK